MYRTSNIEPKSDVENSRVSAVRRSLVSAAAVAGITIGGVFLHWSITQAQDKPVAQQITCVNNLRQIGIAFGVWAGDHSDRFPFEVSTNEGGTRELVKADKDGFALDPTAHFQVLTNSDQLKTPLVLVCPQDTSKKPAMTFPELRAGNVTYRLYIPTNSAGIGATDVLVVCPIDGNTLHRNGSVSGRADPHAMHVP